MDLGYDGKWMFIYTNGTIYLYNNNIAFPAKGRMIPYVMWVDC